MSEGYIAKSGDFVVTALEEQQNIDSNRADKLNNSLEESNRIESIEDEIERIVALLGEKEDGFVKYAFKHLSHEMVSHLAKQALNGDRPGALFNYLVKREVSKVIDKA